MGLECLIVTGDPTLLGHVQASLGTHGASLQLSQDCANAIELASRRHLDGLMIDCDDVPGGTKALARLRSTPANQQTLIYRYCKRLDELRSSARFGSKL